MKHSLSCLCTNFSVFGYRVKHSFLCVIYFFLLGGKDETFDSPEDTGEEEKHKLSRSAIKPDKIKLTVVKFAEEDPIVKLVPAVPELLVASCFVVLVGVLSLKYCLTCLY